MAGAISKITAALGSIHNENSVSLANLNFDFTLVKLEVPGEYNGLGATISRKRKIEAEEGALHKTARRLGALFTGMLPKTDDLFKAYGTRVSEISAMPSINPRDSAEKEGIFASHVGVDTASIWAAVTSGSSAIAAHLLGCMLARMFTGPEAISVWVELVQKQKEKILGKNGQILYSHEHQAELVAAQQEISRSDLANWDASARAWLQSADEAKAVQHKQTMLILDNASVPVNNEPDTYTSVMKAWTGALEAMGNLINGMPQRVQDGAALLAISSWHMYPDMVVYGPGIEVKQKDPLFGRAALLTLGLQHLRDDKKSVYWSLPLACLQYYGHPIHTSRSAGQENSRITYQQFGYVLLGCLFAGWKNFAQTNEDGIEWMLKLGAILKISGVYRRDENQKPTWLRYLLTAVQDLDDCDVSERKTAFQLMNLGRRRSTFLYGNGKTPPPLFGLCQVSVLLAVFKSNMQRVQLLRELFAYLNLERSQFIISYPASDDNPSAEYASLAPTSRSYSKRMHDGTLKSSQTMVKKHVRWITMVHSQLEICVRRSQEFLDITGSETALKGLEKIEREFLEHSMAGDTTQTNFSEFSLVQHEDIHPERQQRLDDIRELRELITIGCRIRQVEGTGESCLPVVDWNIDPQHTYYENGLIFSLEPDFLDACRDLLVKVKTAYHTSVAVQKSLFVGDPKISALYSIAPPQMKPPSPCATPNPIVSPKHLEQFFVPCNFDTGSLYHNFSNSSMSEQLAQNEIRCLRACSMMADVYKLLPGATISTLVVNQTLNRASWIPGSHQQMHDSLTLSQAFACAAMFESGTCNVDPSCLSEAFAMSSGNSLFVAPSLLCDPYEAPAATELRRVVGNIGRAGITFLICPPEVKTRESDPEKWMAINHNIFDGNSEDHFQQSSIHLSFTEYEVPIMTESYSSHIIDRPVVLVESLISVFDGSSWVGEVDILKAFRNSVIRIPSNGTASHSLQYHKSREVMSYSEALIQFPHLAATSVENWDELIEAPSTGVIAIRAHKNWLARLAAMAVCAKHGFQAVILPQDPCWQCVANFVPASGDVKLALIS